MTAGVPTRSLLSSFAIIESAEQKRADPITPFTAVRSVDVGWTAANPACGYVAMWLCGGIVHPFNKSTEGKKNHITTTKVEEGIEIGK